MIEVKRSRERGEIRYPWLESRLTFSFGDYLDARYSGLGALRALNDNRIQPGAGFGLHPHFDVEIVTYVLEGQLGHKDSAGSGSIIQAGEVHRTTAGRGVLHSEFNGSMTEPVRYLQLYTAPERTGLAPTHEQLRPQARRGELTLLASRDGRRGSLTLHCDANVYVGVLDKDDAPALRLAAGRRAWVHVVRGKVQLNGRSLRAGDGAAVTDQRVLEFAASSEGEVLVVDVD